MSILIFGMVNLHAQNGAQGKNAISGYAGRYFLVGFMQNELILLPGGIRLSISISTIRPTSLRVAAPISGPSLYYQIPGDTVIELTFNYTDVEVYDSERPLMRAIELESDQPITVSGMSSQSLSTDGYSAIPVAKWGREYVVHSWPNDIYMHDDDPQGKIPRSSEFMVIASENNTAIEFTPRSRTLGKIQPGTSTIITLNKGQCYLVKSDTLPAGSGDLSGTIVRSDKPVGVFSGHLRTAIPIGLQEFDSKNHLTEMLYPTEQWGKTFITLPFTNDGMGDFFRFHCIEPNTTVTVKGWNVNQTHVLTNPGDFKTLTFMRDPLLIESDKPISIAQYMTSSFSSNERLQTFDPCMMLIPSVDKCITKASFHVVNNPSTNPKQFSKHFISLVCTDDAVDHVMLDNRLVKTIVSNLPNQRVNGTQFFYATIPVTPGAHQLSTMEGSFNAGLYGTGSDDAYAYPLAFGMVKGIDTSAPSIVLKDSCGIVKGTIQERLVNDYSGLHDISIIRDSTQNMNWAIGGIRDGDLSTSFTATVIDMSKDANFVIEVMDNAGNVSRNRYSYTAPKITISDSLIFPKIKLGDTAKRMITLVNTGKVYCTIDFALLSGDDQFTSSNISNLNGRKLAPNDTFVIYCDFIGEGKKDTAKSTIFLSLGCGITKSVTLLGFMESVSISVEGYDFGAVSVGDSKIGNIRIVNTGGLPLNIFGFIFSGMNDFIIDSSGIFPKMLRPLDTLNIPCHFSPKMVGKQAVTFSLRNDNSLPNQAELKGIGIFPKIQGFTVDWKERRIGSQQDSLLLLTNSGNDIAQLHLDSLFVNDSIFDISFPGGKQDAILKPNESISITCRFSPKNTIVYQRSGYIHFSNGFLRDSVPYTLIGKGVVPALLQKDIYVGRIREFTKKDTTGALFLSNGSIPVTISSFSIISGDSASFEIDTMSIRGVSFSPNETYSLPIRFIPKRPGNHSIRVRIISDAAAFGNQSITESDISGDANALDTISVRMELQAVDTMHICERRVISGRIINDGNIDVRLDSLKIESSNGISLIEIQSLSDSVIAKKGGMISFVLSIDAQSKGYDDIICKAFIQDSIFLVVSRAIVIKPNHIHFKKTAYSSISYLPGNKVNVVLSGDFDIAEKTPLQFEPEITLKYPSNSIACETVLAEMDMQTVNGQIRIPMQVTDIPGNTIVSAQTTANIQSVGSWSVALSFRTFLAEDPGTIQLVLKNKASDCIIGDTLSIPLETEDFCAKDIRVVTGDMKGQGFLGMFPHPMSSNGKLSFLLHNDSEYSFMIQSMLGETVLKIQGKGIAGLNIIPLDVSDLPSGGYTLIFQTVNTLSTTQFIITKQ